MKKLSISKKLENYKRYRIPSRWASLFHYIVMTKFEGKKYNMKFDIVDSVKDCDGPCFVIFNHQSRPDHAFVVGATYPRRVNFVAGCNEFYRQKFKFPFKHGRLIPKRNYTPDTRTIKGITKIIKSGGCVAFSPEGLASNYGSNKPIVPGTGKLFKHFGVPVYVCRISGGYLQNTKVCLDIRPGEVDIKLYKIFSSEDVNNLSVEEMEDKVNEAFKTNEYAWNREHMIKYDTKGKVCERLEDFLYRCPKCGKEFEMKGSGDVIKCNSCGNGTKLDDYYQFHPFEGSIIPEDTVAWVEEERVQLIHEIRENSEYSFSDEVKIGTLDDSRYIKDKVASSFIVGEGRITVDHTGFHYNGTRDGKPFNFDIDYNHMYTTITINDASYFSFWNNGEFFDIFPLHQTVGKFILLIEEMHRYHVNYYKNFKWNDWMYEGLELGIDNKVDA